MTQLAARVGDVRTSAVARAPADTRRLLQLVLASLWLVDGLLQIQPYMFSRAFGTQMLAATARGNPATLARSIRWAGAAIGGHAVAADTVFALVQLAIAAGIAWRPTVKPALALSVGWAACVWWFGEGFGGVFAGTATIVDGAPGAVLLYALAAVLLWPADRAGATAPFVAARAVGERTARVLWVLVWGVLACVTVVGPDRPPGGLSRVVTQLAAGEPGWLAHLDHHVAAFLVHGGTAVAAVLAGALAAVAVGVLLPTGAARASLVLACTVAAAIWVVGENFGGVLSGTGTDVSTAPLLVLLAAAYWPRRDVAPLPALVAGTVEA